MIFDKTTQTAAVIGAMECEVSLLCGLLENGREYREGRFLFHRGKIGGTDVVIARAGVGKVNAAVCTATLIAKFSPAFVINTGCMGGIDPVLRQNDVVVATDTVEYDITYGSLGTPEGVIFLPDGGEADSFACDEEISERLCEAVGRCGRTAHRGRIVSGDRFVSDSAFRNYLRERFGASGCEMEGAAAAHACALAKVPFGLVRSVSDTADGDAGISFDAFAEGASRLSAQIVSEFISSL